jgi:hypothetical protein
VFRSRGMSLAMLIALGAALLFAMPNVGTLIHPA